MDTECMKNADARERFLRFLGNLPGKEVDVNMYERTMVSGELVAVKGDGTHYLMDKLKTPIGVLDSVVLRTSDTISLTVDWTSMCPNC